LSDEDSEMSTNNNPPPRYNYDVIYPYEYIPVCQLCYDSKTDTCSTNSVNSTELVPLPPKVGYAVCWNMHKEEWYYVPDHRGKVYWTTDMVYNEPGILITSLGDLPTDASFIRPKASPAQQRVDLELTVHKYHKLLIDNGVTVDGIKFDTDSSALTAYCSFLMIAKNIPDHTSDHWQASKNVFVTMTAPLCFAVLKTCLKYLDGCYKFLQLKLEELKDTPDEELDQFDPKHIRRK